MTTLAGYTTEKLVTDYRNVMDHGHSYPDITAAIAGREDAPDVIYKAFGKRFLWEVRAPGGKFPGVLTDEQVGGLIERHLDGPYTLAYRGAVLPAGTAGGRGHPEQRWDLLTLTEMPEGYIASADYLYRTARHVAREHSARIENELVFLLQRIQNIYSAQPVINSAVEVDAAILDNSMADFRRRTNAVAQTDRVLEILDEMAEKAFFLQSPSVREAYFDVLMTLKGQPLQKAQNEIVEKLFISSGAYHLYDPFIVHQRMTTRLDEFAAAKDEVTVEGFHALLQDWQNADDYCAKNIPMRNGASRGPAIKTLQELTTALAQRHLAEPASLAQDKLIALACSVSGMEALERSVRSVVAAAETTIRPERRRFINHGLQSAYRQAEPEFA
jgi:hypothetical protein